MWYLYAHVQYIYHMDTDMVYSILQSTNETIREESTWLQRFTSEEISDQVPTSKEFMSSDSSHGAKLCQAMPSCDSDRLKLNLQFYSSYQIYVLLISQHMFKTKLNDDWICSIMFHCLQLNTAQLYSYYSSCVADSSAQSAEKKWENHNNTHSMSYYSNFSWGWRCWSVSVNLLVFGKGWLMRRLTALRQWICLDHCWVLGVVAKECGKSTRKKSTQRAYSKDTIWENRTGQLLDARHSASFLLWPF